jgi:hypothetical protein
MDSGSRTKTAQRAASHHEIRELNETELDAVSGGTSDFIKARVAALADGVCKDGLKQLDAHSFGTSLYMDQHPDGSGK